MDSSNILFRTVGIGERNVANCPLPTNQIPHRDFQARQNDAVLPNPPRFHHYRRGQTFVQQPIVPIVWIPFDIPWVYPMDVDRAVLLAFLCIV